MKKKFLIAVVAAASLTLAAFAYAQTTTSALSAAAAPAADKTQDTVRFNAHKKKLLNDLGEHIARMQKKQSCIQAAADEKTLGICFSGEKDAGHQSAGSKMAVPQPAPVSPVKQ